MMEARSAELGLAGELVLNVNWITPKIDDTIVKSPFTTDSLLTTDSIIQEGKLRGPQYPNGYCQTRCHGKIGTPWNWGPPNGKDWVHIILGTSFLKS